MATAIKTPPTIAPTMHHQIAGTSKHKLALYVDPGELAAPAL